MDNVFIGLGSNLGNRLAFMRGGRDALLATSEVALVRASSVYETVPVGGPADSPLFLNAVLQVITSLQPQELLEVCLAIEEDFGRTRPKRWAPRTLDIDILMYGDHVLDHEHLVIPHPRFHERAFVMAPMQEIAPDILHPRLLRDMTALASKLPEVLKLKPIRETW